MAHSIQPTSQERLMRENDFIVSKTDRKGKITYCNRIFIEFSGYSEQELLGAPHNIIRHPDMPRGVFQLLWDKIGNGQECFAYVKNMAKDGSFYWVLANVTPDFDSNGQITGYFSVRRRPRPEAVRAMEQIYAEMRRQETGSRHDAPKQSLQWLSALLAEKKTSYEEFVLSL